VSAGVAEAERAAAVAGAEVQAAEAQIASGARRTVSAGALNKLRDTWRHAELAREGARARAEREHKEARLSALAEVGAQADELAASLATELPRVVAAAVAGLAALHQLEGEYDATLAGLMSAAAELGAEPPAPSGSPRESSPYVALTSGRDALMHKNLELRPIGPAIGKAIACAIEGDAEGALAAVSPVTVRKPQRLDHYFRTTGGQILGMSDPLHPGIVIQVKAGELTPLEDPDEVDRYLRGELG
jgi:hypothetical protein